MVSNERGPGKPLADCRDVVGNRGTVRGFTGGVIRLNQPIYTHRQTLLPQRVWSCILVSQDWRKANRAAK